jgi:hypothetical protein
MAIITDTREARYWTAPCLDPATGVITLDGAERLRIWEPGVGARHSVIHGGPATGKTELALWLATEYMHAGVVVPWAADPLSAQSLIPIAAHCDWTSVSAVETVNMLQVAGDLLAYRVEALAGRVLDPSAEEPMLRLVIEAADMILRDPEHGPDAVGLLEQLALHGPRAGIGLDLIVPEPTQVFLRSPRLLAALEAGNMVGMRSIDGNPGFLPGEPPCRAPLVRDPGAAVASAAPHQPTIDWAAIGGSAS